MILNRKFLKFHLIKKYSIYKNLNTLNINFYSVSCILIVYVFLLQSIYNKKALQMEGLYHLI